MIFIFISSPTARPHTGALRIDRPDCRNSARTDEWPLGTVFFSIVSQAGGSFMSPGLDFHRHSCAVLYSSWLIYKRCLRKTWSVSSFSRFFLEVLQVFHGFYLMHFKFFILSVQIERNDPLRSLRWFLAIDTSAFRILPYELSGISG